MMMVGFADETVVGGESVGARLRSAREAHGLSLDDVAARTRVPTRHLKAIEEDAFDQLPAAPYSVGFAKAFADAVGLNRDEIGREFRAEKEGYGSADAGPTYVSEEPSASGYGGIVRLVIILLVVIAAGYGLWRSGLFGSSAPVEAPPAPPPAAEQPAAPPSAPEAQPSTAASDESTSRSEERSSRPKQSDTPDAKSDKSSRDKDESGDETSGKQSSAKSSEPAASAAPEREPTKTTRQLNEEALKPAAPVTLSPPPPAAAPPLITPPPPPPAAAPAAPSATP